MNPSSQDSVTRRILGDLAPVRRLPRPWKRALPVCALGLLLAALVSASLGVRHDRDRLGAIVLWGLSALQMGYAVVLIGAALRLAIPGRLLARGSAALLLLAGGGLALGITWITWWTHASHVPPGRDALYWGVCFRTPMAIGAPALLLTLLLVFRAYPTQPVLTGALAGLGAGLLSDGSWRTFCEVSDPSHVLGSHALAVLALAVAGMVFGGVAGRVAGKRRKD
jgi:hypothetical protein